MKKLYAMNLVLVGVLVGIVFAWACGPDSTSVPPAHAQASTCQNWEVAYMAMHGTVNAPFPIPAGWEPFADGVTRRCAD